ncbi:hypothetical protein DBR34_08560 [Stenotrophomonas sp. HMWF003]|nr:hypothetical protein DBR34_08560 [Stenotrophomonas sp. HMWF003]
MHLVLICLYHFEGSFRLDLFQWRLAPLGAISADLPELKQRYPLMVVRKESLHIVGKTGAALALYAERPV